MKLHITKALLLAASINAVWGMEGVSTPNTSFNVDDVRMELRQASAIAKELAAKKRALADQKKEDPELNRELREARSAEKKKRQALQRTEKASQLSFIESGGEEGADDISLTDSSDFNASGNVTPAKLTEVYASELPSPASEVEITVSDNLSQGPAEETSQDNEQMRIADLDQEISDLKQQLVAAQVEVEKHRAETPKKTVGRNKIEENRKANLLIAQGVVRTLGVELTNLQAERDVLMQDQNKNAAVNRPPLSRPLSS